MTERELKLNSLGRYGKGGSRWCWRNMDTAKSPQAEG